MKSPSETTPSINIVANASLGPGMSGGDRIFIECAKRWARQGHTVNVFVWEEGYEMCQRNKLEGVNYVIWSAARYKKLGFALLYLIRTIKGCIETSKLSLSTDGIIIYSASDFWPDSLPAYIMKKRSSNAKWVVALYLFAPNPLKGFRHTHKKGYRVPKIKELLYYLSQELIDWLITRNADFICVTNEVDRHVFIDRGIDANRVIAVRGGVDIKEVSRVLPKKEGEYAASFVGRFHPQKGVLELVEIWDHVCKVKKDAKLAIIGQGRLEGKLREEIEKRGLEDNVDLLGFLDGEKKYEILKSSRVFLHPPIYDSGGMAACEGMACGLPAVGFDLPALKTYYPRGMLKSPIGDVRGFAGLVINLLEDGVLYSKTKNEALDLAEEWDWDKRAEEIMRIIGAA